jgi:hypothetical protein
MDFDEATRRVSKVKPQKKTRQATEVKNSAAVTNQGISASLLRNAKSRFI